MSLVSVRSSILLLHIGLNSENIGTIVRGVVCITGVVIHGIIAGDGVVLTGDMLVFADQPPPPAPVFIATPASAEFPIGVATTEKLVLDKTELIH
jgi:hypothetical protein